MSTHEHNVVMPWVACLTNLYRSSKARSQFTTVYLSAALGPSHSEGFVRTAEPLDQHTDAHSLNAAQEEGSARRHSIKDLNKETFNALSHLYTVYTSPPRWEPVSSLCVYKRVSIGQPFFYSLSVTKYAITSLWRLFPWNNAKDPTVKKWECTSRRGAKAGTPRGRSAL